MMTHTLQQLLNGIVILPEHLNVTIQGMALDSRQIKPGDVFFAFKGTHLDGREFIVDAIKKGAIAILIEAEEAGAIHTENAVPVIPVRHLSRRVGEIAARFYGYPATAVPVVGVTGTSGKTSCSYFIASALQQLGLPCGVIGTLGTGFVDHIRPGSLTTPDAVTLQKTFAELHEQGAKVIAMEVSSHSLDQGRVNGTEFAVGVFTNLSRDHLDYHGTMVAYGQAKKRLFELSRAAVVNADDAVGAEWIQSFAGRDLLYPYGLRAPSDLPFAVNENYCYADRIELSIEGIKATLHTPWGEGELAVRLIGRFNLSNIVAALTTLCLLNVPFEQAVAALSTLTSVPGRMETLGGQSKPLVVVDYAHKPDALEKVLMALKQHCKGQLYCIFGCGGDRDKGKRPMMAKIAEQYADKVIVTDDNPRTEDPKQIVADIMQGFLQPNQVIVQHDRSKAIRDVIHYAVAGDCVLVAGKGAEAYQQIGDKKIPFSDIEQVKETLVE